MGRRKLALVTGGTRGIGRAVVDRLCQDDCCVVLAARDADAVSRVEAELRGAEFEVYGMAADVRRPSDIRGLVDFALDKSAGKGIDILVNNAGRSGGGATAKITDELWNDVVETNLNALFRLTREVLQRGRMLENAWGRIINMASTGGKQGVVLGAPYSASKHAVVGFTKSLGLELAKTGVTVNAVCPGFVETDLAGEVRRGFAAVWNCTPDEAKQRIEQRIPTGRYVAPLEVAALVAFLAGTAQSSVTAQAINVCGGLGNY